MSHPLLKTAIRLLFTVTLLLAPAKIAHACFCPAAPSVLNAYEAADAVLIVRLLSFERVETFGPNGSASPGNMRKATVIVERVYKGNMKVNDQLIFGQSLLLRCNWTFDEQGIDSEFLLYVKTPKTDSDTWSVLTCGRSKLVSQATEDLLYLDNMKTLRGKTRVSGRYSGWSGQDLVVAHRSIRIVGEKETYETFTDEKGFFEIYDLPPGEYRLEPEIPEGWRIDRLGVRFSSSIATRFLSPKSVRLVMDTKQHVSINLPFQPDNTVEGRIVGPKGNPLANTCAYLRRPDEIANEALGSTGRDCTDENGNFRIESVVPGTYVLVLNLSGIPKSQEPFPRVFYPGTTELEKATSITVGLGQTVKDINVVVPVLLDTITVQGVLYFSDGQPAPKQTVRFDPVERPGVIGFTAVDTDEQGRFSLKLLKGLPGNLESGIAIIPGMHRNCPEWDALKEHMLDTYVHVRTQETKIEADRDLVNLVLRFPVPSCQPKP